MATFFPWQGMILSLSAPLPAFGSITSWSVRSCLSWIWANSLLDHVPGTTKSQCDSSWTVLYVGIAVADLSCRNQRIAYLALLVWFDLSSLSLIYHDLKQSPFTQSSIGPEGIIVLPFPSFSSLVRVGGASLPVWCLLIMVLAS